MPARAAVAIGVFDGLHLGHRAILERAVERARERSAPCVVLSFDPHPDVVLAKGEFRIPAPLTPLQEKRARMKALGVDALEMIPFTRELAALDPEEFVERYLVGPYALHALVVGHGFALGRGRSGNVERLRAIGTAHSFAVDELPLLEIDGAPVSSTRIRTLLAEGRVREAARLLGRNYSLFATVVTGEGIGRTLGYPTANLRLHEEKLVPRDGIYAARVQLEGEDAWRPGAMSIGMRPTFDGQMRTLEVYLLDWSGELPGRNLEVELVDWLRIERKFESLAELVRAIDEDVAEVRRRLGMVEA
ncbi:MAG TPA: bifunctional riboflavin kinase/FAD synthetase [Candidatus Limnocylindria bacterium]|nr:bifunctional riboflavin kinase/FAD synthetase [Candidatus Limnocylindria bacterium]